VLPAQCERLCATSSDPALIQTRSLSLAERLREAERRVARLVGPYDVVAELRHRAMAASAAKFEEAYATWAGDGTIAFPPADEQPRRAPPAEEKRHQLAPGYAELAAAGWSALALRPWVPPCVGGALDACFRDRHPHYPERVLISTILCDVEGLASDEAAYKAVWASLFQHPEPSCRELYGDPAGKLEASQYGKKARDDMRAYCSREGGGCGCPFAIGSGLCPFALDTDPSGATEIALRDQGRVPPPASLGRVQRAKVLCMNYFCATTHTQPSRIDVPHPRWFYCRAKKI